MRHWILAFALAASACSVAPDAENEVESPDAATPPPNILIMRLVECSSLVAIRAMLLNSDRATVLSSHQAGYEIDKGDLSIVNFRLDGSTRPIGVTTRQNWRPTGLQAGFLEQIRSEANHL